MPWIEPRTFYMPKRCCTTEPRLLPITKNPLDAEPWVEGNNMLNCDQLETLWRNTEGRQKWPNWMAGFTSLQNGSNTAKWRHILNNSTVGPEHFHWHNSVNLAGGKETLWLQYTLLKTCRNPESNFHCRWLQRTCTHQEFINSSAASANKQGLESCRHK